MTRRVLFQGGGSALRVSASGVDASSAQFNTLIFDANQPPMRLWGTGWLSIDGMSRDEFGFGQNIREGSPVTVFTPPSGKTPIFCVMTRPSDRASWGPIGIGDWCKTPGYQSGENSTIGGAGGAICAGNQFIPVCFRVATTPTAPTVRPPVTYVNYLVFKNWQ